MFSSLPDLQKERGFPHPSRKKKLLKLKRESTYLGRSAVGQCLNLPQPHQSLISGHQSQAEHLSGCGQKTVRRVGVWQGKLLRRQHNLMGKRSFPQVRRGACQPSRQISVQPNSTLGVQQQRLPGAHWRQPELVVSIRNELADAPSKATRFPQAPQPNMRIE